MIGWWDEEEFRQVPARLCDLSSSGAALLIEEPSPQTESIWICLAGENPTEWARTTRARTTPMKDGAQRLGLAFTEFCPNSLFKVAIWGRPRLSSNPADPDSRLSGWTPVNTPPPPPPPREPVPTVPPPATSETEAAPEDVDGRSPLDLIADFEEEHAEKARKRRKKKPGRFAAMLTWLMPLFLNLTLALLLAVLALVTFTDSNILEPLVLCLTQE